MTSKLKIVLSVVSVIYPFALFFAGDFAFWVVWALAVLWIARGAYSSGFERKLSIAAAVFFIVCMIFKSGFLAYLYPVLVSLAFLAFFAFSLKNEAVITKIAKLKEPNLDGFCADRPNPIRARELHAFISENYTKEFKQ